MCVQNNIQKYIFFCSCVCLVGECVCMYAECAVYAVCKVHVGTRPKTLVCRKKEEYKNKKAHEHTYCYCTGTNSTQKHKPNGNCGPVLPGICIALRLETRYEVYEAIWVSAFHFGMMAQQ